MNNYKLFDTIIKRTPFYPLESLSRIPSSYLDVDKFVFDLYGNTFFKESIYIASPELLLEWEKSYEKNKKPEDRRRINATIIKYFLRATSKCTPFGLFSTYSAFSISSNNSTYNALERFSTIDTHFLVNLVETLNRNNFFRENVVYKANTTLYQIGKEFRYFEVVIEDGRRSHTLTSLENDEILSLVIEESKNGRSIKELKEVLLKLVVDIEESEAKEYIESLINSQVLVSEFDICLNTESPFEDIVNFFRAKRNFFVQDPYINSVTEALITIKAKLKEIDSDEIGNQLFLYKEIIHIIRKMGIPFEEKYIVNTTLKRNHPDSNSIDSCKIEMVKKAVKILHLFSTHSPEKIIDDNINLKNFKDAFQERYEEREVPLLLALDNEAGIGYIQHFNDYNAFSNLIDDLDWSSTKGDIEEELIVSSRLHQFWANAFIGAISTNSISIDLKDYDLSQFDNREETEIFGTFSVMISKSGDSIHIVSAGGTSALNLFARYSLNDTNLKTLASNICQWEQKIFPDKIVAEVLHLPHNRAGNVLLRYVERNYEIPILSKSFRNNVISLSDMGM